MENKIHHSILVSQPSEEVEEIVSQAPKGIIKWGTAVIILVIMIITSVSIFVEYADIVSGAFTLTASNAPKSVPAMTDGKLLKLVMHEHDNVKQGGVIAYIESMADHAEVFALSSLLDSTWQYIRNDHWEELKDSRFSNFKRLGELQSYYQTFMSAYIQLRGNLRGNLYAKKKQLMETEITNLNQLNFKLSDQLKVYLEDQKIAAEDFYVKQQLYDEKVIPLLEFKQEKSKFLSKQLPMTNTQISVINNNSVIAQKKQELILLEQTLAEQKSNFIQSLNTLASNIDAWKKKYLLIAPIDGEVTWPALLQENQDIKAGTELFFITPDHTKYFGEILVTQDNCGKLALDQEVLISLAGYPYQEYGKLHGKISFISKFPDKDAKYMIGVVLENALRTDLQKDINFRNGLVGTAEIITMKSRLINKFFYSIRGVLDKPH